MNFWQGFEKRAAIVGKSKMQKIFDGLMKEAPKQVFKKKGSAKKRTFSNTPLATHDEMSRLAMAGKPLPASYVESVVKRVADPMRQKNLREIAKKNPVWFVDYEEIADIE